MKLAAGENRTSDPERLTAPLTGVCTEIRERVSPSMSVSFARRLEVLMTRGVSSGVVDESLLATGGSFRGVTVIRTVAVSSPPAPSKMVYVKLAGPA